MFDKFQKTKLLKEDTFLEDTMTIVIEASIRAVYSAYWEKKCPSESWLSLAYNSVQWNSSTWKYENSSTRTRSEPVIEIATIHTILSIVIVIFKWCSSFFFKPSWSLLYHGEKLWFTLLSSSYPFIYLLNPVYPYLYLTLPLSLPQLMIILSSFHLLRSPPRLRPTVHSLRAYKRHVYNRLLSPSF